MEANELRIGNKVLNPYHGRIYTVEGFKYSRDPDGERRAYISTYEHSGNTVKVSILQPVPLNEKWLQEAGARTDKSGDSKKWILGIFTVVEKDGAYAVSPGNDYWIPVIYVHDLQNLYFYHNNKTDLF
jgi:hypothetical protein